MPSSAITTVDAAAAADGHVAVELVVHGPASQCADVEAVTAVHGAVALLGQVLQDLADVDGHPTDADVTIILSTIIHTIIKILHNLTKHEQHHHEQQQPASTTSAHSYAVPFTTTSTAT